MVWGGALRPKERGGHALRSEKLLLRCCASLGEPYADLWLPTLPSLLSLEVLSGRVKVTMELLCRCRGGTGGGVAAGGVPTVN